MGSEPGTSCSTKIQPSLVPPPAPSHATSATAGRNVALGTRSDDELVAAACEKISKSVLKVKFDTIKKQGVRSHIESIIRALPSSKEKKEWRAKMEEELEVPSHSTTGFVVGDTKTTLLVLTCAHSFQLCFNESNPMSAATVRKLYDISVHCDHNELHHRGNRHEARVFAKASCVEVDSSKDMLLLEVHKRFCSNTHPPLALAQSVPRCLGLVGMVSWPFERHRTTCKGNISHHERDFNEMSFENRHGYNFTGIEVNISAEPGSSGSPLVDLSSDVIGLLHGGRIECFTNFVSLEDIRKNLNSWGVATYVEEMTGGGGGSSSSKRQRVA